MEGVRHYETDCFAQPLPEGGVALRQVSYTQIGPNALWLDVSASPDKIPG